MFIHWKQRSIQGTKRCNFPCIHEGKVTASIRPVLKASVWYGGRSHQMTVWQPALSIRLCCAEDPETGFVRAAWWNDVNKNINKVPTDWKNCIDKKWVASELSKRISLPTSEDKEIWRLWPEIDVERRKNESLVRYHQRSLVEVRKTINAVRSQIFSPLGLTWPCTKEDVIQQFRKGVRRHHPDGGGTCASFIEWNSLREEALSYLEGLED